MDLNYFKNNISKFVSYYKPGALFDKIKKLAKKLGIKTVYVLLLLYYATLDKSLPVKDRIMVLAALGYFIMPVDMIPDALPVGFADDSAALLFVLKQVWNGITPATKEKALARLAEWFGNPAPSDLLLPGLPPPAPEQ